MLVMGAPGSHTLHSNEAIFKYQIFTINPNIPIKLQQCELSHKREFDHLPVSEVWNMED
jgi:hypothetical protein